MGKSFFNLAWIYIHPANDKHIIGTAGNGCHFYHVYFRCIVVIQAGNIIGPVAQQRHAFFGQCSNHQYTFFACWYRLFGNRIQDLGIEMVFPDITTSFFLKIFHSDPWADNFT
ncbi:hypothetical protein D3C86_1497840 [compost metagenome]